jgi:tetrahydromethanopterin S-methyltransferase subunit F
MIGNQKPTEPPPMMQQPEQSSLSMRLRVLEEKSNNLNRKIEFLERNMVASNKKKNEMLRNFDTDLLDIKREIDSLKQKTDLIVRELKLSAGKDELNTIKRYLDLWNLARFVTREEVEHIAEEAVEKYVSAKALKHPVPNVRKSAKQEKELEEDA